MRAVSDTELHVLPCHFQEEVKGEAAVSTYFLIQTAATQSTDPSETLLGRSNTNIDHLVRE